MSLRKDYIHRKDLLKKLQEKNVDPYPHKFDVKNEIMDIIQNEEKYLGKNVKVAGRVSSIRGHGKVCFSDIIDNDNKIQLFLKKDILGDDYDFLKEFVDRGDFLWVDGKVMKTQKGELSILANHISLLSKAMYDLPHQWFGLEDVEKRYRMRYLDLMLNQESREIFRKRSEAIFFIRQFLVEKNFLEMETPVLQPVYGGANAKPFKSKINAIKKDYFLRISPELYLKRLLVGGYSKVFEIARNFRNEDIDTTHNPEFTMIEIYQAYADYNDMMSLTEQLISKLFKNINNSYEFEWGNHKINFKPPWKKIKMVETLKEKLPDLDDKTLQKEIEKNNIEISGGYNRGLAISKLFEKYFEETLIQPTFVIDYPKETTPLCKPHREDKDLVERFELYIGGMELANGYSELNNPAIQEALFKEEAEKRKMGDVEAHQYDEDFVEALKWGMPNAGGVGIGIDRLIMLLTNKNSIKEVILFPIQA